MRIATTKLMHEMMGRKASFLFSISAMFFAIESCTLLYFTLATRNIHAASQREFFFFFSLPERKEERSLGGFVGGKRIDCKLNEFFSFPLKVDDTYVRT